MRKFFFVLTIVSGISLIIGCTGGQLPPVTNAALETSTQYSYYTVQRGDTIYSIAWEFGLDYVNLGETNHLKSPYAIFPGQRLQMTIVPKSSSRQQTTVAPPILVHRKPDWVWPVKGKVFQGFSPGVTGNNGVNIAAPLNSPVWAAHEGQVVYSSSGIRGYGNLIIIKHDRHYMSAYAFNQKLFVKLGEHVHRGQQIGTVGHNDAGKVMLHFEIRQDGKPVDPIIFY